MFIVNVRMESENLSFGDMEKMQKAYWNGKGDFVAVLDMRIGLF